VSFAVIATFPASRFTYGWEPIASAAGRWPGTALQGRDEFSIDRHRERDLRGGDLVRVFRLRGALLGGVRDGGELR
jgi:hypothetical protein